MRGAGWEGLRTRGEGDEGCRVGGVRALGEGAVRDAAWEGPGAGGGGDEGCGVAKGQVKEV